MAELTTNQLSELRQGMPAGDWNKQTINAALQAIEDWFESVKASGVTAINEATAPFVFTGAQKTKLFKHWLNSKFQREV